MFDQLKEENLKKTCIERREILRQQALILISEQTAAAAKGGGLGPTLHLAHTSLLYPGLSKWEKCGIAHVEQKIIEDMEQIFSELNGEKISLEEGLAASYIDVEGKIHLPRPKGVSQDSIQLATHYTNVSVAHTLTPDMITAQKERTKAVVAALKEEIEKRKAEIDLTPKQSSDLSRAKWLVTRVEEKLQKNTTFEAAAELIEAEKLMGWAVSTGCYSNKDRGGLVGRAVLTRLFTRKMESSFAWREKRARAFEEENPYVAYVPGSCQLQFIQGVVSGQQRCLKALPNLSKAWMIPRVCLPIIVRAGAARLVQSSSQAASELWGRVRNAWMETVSAVARRSFEALDDVGAGEALRSSRTPPHLEKKDEMLGFNRTRGLSSFSEEWVEGGQPVARETIQAVGTRESALASVQKTLGEITSEIIDASGDQKIALERRKEENRLRSRS